MKSVTLFTLAVWGCLVCSTASRAQSPDGSAHPRIQVVPYQPHATEVVVVGPLRSVPYEPQATEVLVVGPPKEIAQEQRQATKETTVQELKNELKDLRRRLRQIEKRLSEIERTK